MIPGSRLGGQIQELLHRLEGMGVPVALIGGLALAPFRVIRATQDIDLLIEGHVAGQIDDAMRELGYECLHRTSDVANYVRGDQRVDYLFAHRPAASDILAEASVHETPLGRIRVVPLEGLIAFKLQGYVNDPRRTQDLEDIRALLRANRTEVNVPKLRSYFSLFEREPLLEQLLAEI